MGYKYEDDHSRRMAEKKVRRFAPIPLRILLALISLIFPGLGHALQKRGMRAFDFVLMLGAALLISRVFIIQTHWGLKTPIIMLSIFLIPSVLSAISAFRNKSPLGDADAIVRSVFLYIFFYLIAIGPFHLLNYSFGFKVYRFPDEDIHLEPLMLEGDASVIHRGAYGNKTFGQARSDTVKIGDVVYHKPVPESMGGDNFPVHIVLAAPMDTLRAVDGELWVNSTVIRIESDLNYRGPKNFGPVVVPKTQVFLTDNRGVFFPFYINNISGKVTGVLWSRTRSGRFRWNRFGRSIDELFEPYLTIDDLEELTSDSIPEPPIDTLIEEDTLD